MKVPDQVTPLGKVTRPETVQPGLAAQDLPERNQGADGLPEFLFSDPWSLHRTLHPGPHSVDPDSDAAKEANSAQNPNPWETDQVMDRTEIGILLDQVLDEEAARIHPSWFLPDETALPDPLLAFLPEGIEDRVRLLAGVRPTSSKDLPHEIAREIARALWANLSPASPASDLGLRLWNLEDDNLAALFESLGIELAGSLLALVPERSAAALCAALPPVAARNLWLTRKNPVFPTNAAWIRTLAPALQRGASMMLMREFCLAALHAAFADHPGDTTRLVRRLPKNWFGDPGRHHHRPEALPPGQVARERIEALLERL